MSNNRCATEHCPETLNGSKKLYCKNCRAAMYRWSLRTAAEIRNRSQCLQKYQARMANFKLRKETRDESKK